MRSTLADLLASRFPAALNIDPTDSRCTEYANAACQLLVPKMHSLGTVLNMTVALADPHIQNQSLTLPPQFATLEGISICRRPTIVRPVWAMYNGQGPGIQRNADTNWCSGDAAQFIGYYPSFKDVPTGGGRIRLQCDVANDVGVQVLVLGLDTSGNVVRTPKAGVWSDGELVSLAQSPGTLSGTTFSVVTDLQIPSGRSGQIWMYSWDGAANTLIGQYQAYETRPNYRRYLIPVLPNQTQSVPFVDIVGKLEFIPARVATDYLSIGNIQAIIMAGMSVRAAEEHLWSEAAMYLNGGMTKQGVPFQGATQILQEELANINGAEQPSIEVIQAPDGSSAVAQLL